MRFVFSSWWQQTFWWSLSGSSFQSVCMNKLDLGALWCDECELKYLSIKANSFFITNMDSALLTSCTKSWIILNLSGKKQVCRNLAPKCLNLPSLWSQSSKAKAGVLPSLKPINTRDKHRIHTQRNVKEKWRYPGHRLWKPNYATGWISIASLVTCLRQSRCPQGQECSQ